MTSRKTRRSRGSNRGAVMLVVMLLLMMATSTATFAMHATSSEIRASGYTRLALQAQSVGETGLVAGVSMVDQMGAGALQHALMTTETNPSVKPSVAAFEPEIPNGKHNYRIYPEDFLTGDPIDVDGFGPGRIHEPTFIVDINDDFVYTGTIAGQRSDGFSRLQYLHATYTSRGRMRIPGDVRLTGDTRGMNEAASDARAYGISGPFGR